MHQSPNTSPMLCWRKAGRSAQGNDACVEVAATASGNIAVRDSKNHKGPQLTFNPTAWKTFTDQLKNDEHDL